MKKFMSLILAGIIAAGTVMAVSAEDTEPERAKGVVFKAESGYLASTYTGYASGIPCAQSFNVSVKEVLSALENSNGIEIRRGGEKLGESERVLVGDKIVLTAEDGTVKSEFAIMMMGDTNDNGTLNLSDAAGMLKKIAKWDISINEMAADVNGDGALNLADVSLFLKATAGWKDSDFIVHPVFPGKVTMVDSGTANCYDYPGNQGWVPLCLSDGIHYDLGVKFNVAAGKYATQISFLCPSWGDNEGEMTISVYKWDGDYNSSIAATPVISETFVDYEDNTVLLLSLIDPTGKGLVEGEYVWRIHNANDPGENKGVGVWYFEKLAPAESTGMKTFLNNKEFDIGPVSTIFYSSAK